MVAPKVCHNCRSRRLRCDRSVPECHKCTSTGQKCLGYGKLYKWMSNKTLDDRTSENTYVNPISTVQEHIKLGSGDTAYHPEELRPLPLFSPLLDPLFQDLGFSSRRYLHYYNTRFCQDLVIYDSPHRGANPFRDLIPTSQKFPFLREIIVAASALHFYNSARWHKNPRPAVDSLVDALCARHRAIKSLQAVIEHWGALSDVGSDEAERDALLAAVLFFVNFSLVDSGKGGWRAHMNFVGTLLRMRTSASHMVKSVGPTPETQLDSNHNLDSTLHGALIPPPFAYSSVPLPQSLNIRDYIISDSVAYYIWNNALDSLLLSRSKTTAAPSAFNGNGFEILRILQRTEANSYHSCPSRLLYAIFRTSQLARDIRLNKTGVLNDRQIQSCLALLDEIRGFDGDVWASEICAQIVAVVGYLDEAELHYRRHIAATFRAAACLYVLLVAPELPGQIDAYERNSSLALPTTAELAATILHHMSFISTESPLFKFATWPIFLTGVETADPYRRSWVLDRLRDMRALCPWGMLTSTMETLIEIWRMRDCSLVVGESEADGKTLGGESINSLQRDNNHWLMQLQGFKIDCLIV